MNAKELYLTIGQIDDDLILDANAECSKKKISAISLRMIAVVACFCLMLSCGYLHFFSTSVTWNNGITEIAAKFSIPENSTVQNLSADALSDYYHITLPDTLNSLSRMQADAQLYTDTQGDVLYDRNVFRYESADGNKGVNLTLSRISSVPQNTEEKISRILGVSITLTEDTAIPDLLLLSAQWEQNGTTIYLTAEGLSRDEFIAILKELL